ncbi:hypothetical protein EGT07_23670 [Herbaspirillum sp. HC18]|nr:hypothetical protein EGT07_23670 [Herbaspirillum sp. HC18]
MAIENGNQARYRITLYHNGHEYVAEVPELDRCVGYGWSYAAALASAEKSIQEIIDTGGRPDKPPQTTRRYVYRDPAAWDSHKGPSAIVGELLRKKFGKLTMEGFTLRIGKGCGTNTFICAVSGKGPREVRILIALALGIAPSQLWPERPYSTKRKDDQLYLEERRLLGSTLDEALRAA